MASVGVRVRGAVARPGLRTLDGDSGCCGRARVITRPSARRRDCPQLARPTRLTVVPDRRSSQAEPPQRRPSKKSRGRTGDRRIRVPTVQATRVPRRSKSFRRRPTGRNGRCRARTCDPLLVSPIFDVCADNGSSQNKRVSRLLSHSAECPLAPGCGRLRTWCGISVGWNCCLIRKWTTLGAPVVHMRLASFAGSG
jgi:hypothetical protein